MLPRVTSKLRPLIGILTNLGNRLISPVRWRKLQKSEDIKLNLGSRVKDLKNGFTTVDLHGGDIYRNLMKGIPLKDNSVSKIYSSHLLEHFAFEELMYLLGECYRVLKVNGSLSVCVPNAGRYLSAYNQGEYFLSTECYYQGGFNNTQSLIDQVNYIAYLGGQHKYMFDETNLVNVLRITGFSNPVIRKFDLEVDLKARDHESIYAIAFK